MVLIFASIASTQDASNSNKSGRDQATRGTPVSGPPNAAELKSATDDPNYRIGPQDMLRVNVWREPEVSSTVQVRPDGKISLPLLNDVDTDGRTPMQLAEEIATRLKQYLTNPQVTVIVTGVNSKRIYIVGEVGRVGGIAMLPQMTALQALASAGGFSRFANLKKIYILRNENGKEVKIPFNYKDVVSGKTPEQNILLKPGDTIVVP
jgi:polysaccharide export outer membrane protein